MPSSFGLRPKFANKGKKGDGANVLEGMWIRKKTLVNKAGELPSSKDDGFTRVESSIPHFRGFLKKKQEFRRNTL